MYKNRREAGKELARELMHLLHEQPIVLALARGGVPVGYEVAKALHAPLDVVIVRKIGAPNNPEFGIGALAEDGAELLEEKTATQLGLTYQQLVSVVRRTEKELQRRIDLYRNGEQLPDLRGRTVVLVDDGLATGVTAKAAIQAVVAHNAGKIIFAVPVCSSETAQAIDHDESVELICPAFPKGFTSVGQWYDDFMQVTDDEVMQLLTDAKERYQQSFSLHSPRMYL